MANKQNTVAIIAMLISHSLLAQPVPNPQINLSGNVGAIGFPILNSGTINFTSDADMTLSSSSTNTSAVSAKITSMGNLTATRTIRYPAGRFRVAFENATMGGQAINICGPSGSCATIPNDSAHFYDTWNDGTNVVETAIYSATSTTLTGDVTGTGTGTIATTIANKTISINSTACTLGSSCTFATGNLPLYNSGGTQLSSVHAVSGLVTAAGVGIGVTLSGSAAFTSASSYQCFTTMSDASPPPPAIPVNNTNGSQFNIAADTAGGYTGTVSYFCIGN